MESKKIKVGVMAIDLNPPYWKFANEMLWGINTFFLKHHSIADKYDVRLMLWSDIPENPVEISEKFTGYLVSRGDIPASLISDTQLQLSLKEDQRPAIEHALREMVSIRDRGVTIFPTEPIEWPMPTLLRYNLLLQQEEKLREFDYLFYIDVDMKIVDWIGEEILGNLTAAQHPMYALRQIYHTPFESNPETSA